MEDKGIQECLKFTELCLSAYGLLLGSMDKV